MDFSFSDHHEASEPSVMTFPVHRAASGALRPQAGLPGPLTTIAYEDGIEGGRPLGHARSPRSDTSRLDLDGSSRTPSLALTKAAHAPVSPGALLCSCRVGTKHMACDDNSYKNAPSRAAFSVPAGEHMGRMCGWPVAPRWKAPGGGLCHQPGDSWMRRAGLS